MTVPGNRRTSVDLAHARDEVDWVADDDLRALESKSTLGASALGLFTWGGSHLYLGDVRTGLGGLAALIGWIAAAPALPSVVGQAGYWVFGALSAVWSFRRSRALNKFVAVRNELALHQGGSPSSYHLLNAAAAANPILAASLPALPSPPLPSGAHAAVVDQLRKLTALHRAGVINAAEHHDRKIDLLSAAVPETREALDDLLYALLPLADEGVVSRDDFEFVKQIYTGDGREPGALPPGDEP